MACWDSRPGGPLRLPRLLAIAPGEHGRGRPAPREVTQSHERDASAVALLPLTEPGREHSGLALISCTGRPSYWGNAQEHAYDLRVKQPARLALNRLASCV